LTARGDPAHDHVVAGIVARLIDLPRRSVVLAEDETHLNLLPHVRAAWTLRTVRRQIPTPGTNRQVIVLGAIEVTTGAWVYRLGQRCAADFIALLGERALQQPHRGQRERRRPPGHAVRRVADGSGSRGGPRRRRRAVSGKPLPGKCCLAAQGGERGERLPPADRAAAACRTYPRVATGRVCQRRPPRQYRHGGEPPWRAEERHPSPKRHRL
jgi:hypothetical protein